MLTNKKRFGSYLGVFVAMFTAVVLTGCTPAGPRALLDGKRLLDEGKYGQAIEKLKTATTLLSTNANAWNYLGLAYQYGGQPANAVDAYQKALGLNHDLVMVHYNLGCLYLEQNRPDFARNELTAFTLRQNNVVDGWVKLGTAQHRLRETAAAEKSFNEALRMNPQNPEVLNDLALVYLQKNRPSDAENYLNACLRLQPNYAPALLNLAVVEQTYRNNRPLALQKYREYLALKPRPANWEVANSAARDLELELTPTAHPATNVQTAIVHSATNNLKPVASNPVRVANVVTNAARTSEVNTNSIKVANTPPTNKTVPVPPASQPERMVKPEVVKLAEAPTVKPAQDVTASPQRQSAEAVPEAPARTQATATVPALTAKQQEKHGFLQKMNPANLFKHEPKSASTGRAQTAGESPETNSSTQVSSNFEAVSKTTSPTYATVSYPRYSYKSRQKPTAGNRTEAERLVARGAQAQRDRRTKDAETSYQSAVQADASYFEAQSSLGLTAYEVGEMGLSLQAYENALAIKPDAFSARFNFSLGLKKSGYIIDAAQELEKALACGSNEPANNVAAAHLVLANLYADQLHQPQAARPHYVKVLELDPQNSQGTAIRYWLRDNP
ncbi:tetratricopeptide repeat protein [Pedosphaera parvula]|uniref:Tetratricopeptide TPR_2 repeat protein n=1 Tax=Pedosphaera parvula (strain Ellin514) TaxID=320771 RepID=B9XFW6_PEDPL|nr:tetratricopeptide repeat protein [Pedosphaera parvula]EEF61128.1 Tetratricopeptide TPR_2 repeat protein [Pedosphaera parvula Ellin514]